MLSRLAPYLGLGVVLATLAPAMRDARQDSYPFSTYPMFARTLDTRRLLFAEGVAERGSVRLGPALVANDEPMQAMRTLKLAAEAGPRALKALCARIAARVSADAELSSVTRVLIVRGRFDPVRYFTTDATPLEREVLRECRVPRPR